MEVREGTSSEEILQETPRSLNSRVGTPVRFVNHTGRNVKMIWLDYAGKEVFYAKLSGLGKESLSNGHCFEANTFVTHPWIAVDEETNERMLLNFKKVYFPSEPTVRRVDFQRRRALVVRSEIIITIPVYTLEEYCRKVLKKIVPAENISRLPLPPLVLKELSQTY